VGPDIAVVAFDIVWAAAETAVVEAGMAGVEQAVHNVHVIVIH